MSRKFLYVFILTIHFNFCTCSENISERYNFSNTKCENDFDYYLEMVMELEPWALRMFDSSTKIQSGLITGNLIDLGNYDECVDVEHVTPNITINGQYCQLVVNWKIPGYTPKTRLWNVGFSKAMQKGLAILNNVPGPIISICVPHSCSAQDITAYLTNMLQKPIAQIILNQIGISKDKVKNLLFVDEKSCQVKITEKWRPLDYFAVCFLSIIGFICLISTAYDVHLKYAEKEPGSQLLVAFSIYTNGLKLFSIGKNSDQLGCVHGIRFISMLWVIVGHRFSSGVFQPYLNLGDMSLWYDKLSTMYIIGAPVSVDTFFVLSGLLVSYVTLKYLDNGRKLNIPSLYLHRYLRLTPAYIVIILINISLLRHFGSGPYWKFGLDYVESTCTEFWWSAILYVQNYVNPNKVCVPQSWYLSVDMQLFILSPLLIYPACYWSPLRNAIVYGILIFLSMLSPFLVTFINKYSGLMQNASPDYQSLYYLPLHTRFGPWVIGFVLGYYLFRIKTNRSRPIKMSPLTAFLGWVFWICVMITIVWAPHNIRLHPYNRWESSIYYFFFRNVWATAICWVIYACVQGYGGVVNWFLSSPLFQILGRLSYSMYLIHASLQLVEISAVRTTQYFTDYIVLHTCWGDIIYTLFFSLILALMVESPMITIEKVIFGGGFKKSTKNLQYKNNEEVTLKAITHKL